MTALRRPTKQQDALAAPARPPKASRALLLAPSGGLGGGIERYLDAVEQALRSGGTACQRLDLPRPGPVGHARLLANGRAALRSGGRPARLIVAHRRLLPVAALLAREPLAAGLSVLYYGCDAWAPRYRPRATLERLLARLLDARAVAISGFTAGALARDRPAVVLPPVLAPRWFDTLARAAVLPPGGTLPSGGHPRTPDGLPRGHPRTPDGQGAPAGAVGAAESDDHVLILTVFRLEDWLDKGLPELVAAIASMARPEVRLTVCGSGDPPPGLLALLDRHPWCSLLTGLTDSELASQLAAAKLLVLATKTRVGRRACGEGFGLVLLEAQAAGTPVIAPAHGGSHDAYLDGVTGVAPADESAQALAAVLADLLADPVRLERMGKRAAEWAREAFDPAGYPDLVASRLL